ncbi:MULTISPECIES: transposase [Streptococcus]|uniref:transposase n=1 Tax=Streptococcus anginosus TaxID=1328 RepID=UPI00128BC32F|nr:IS110 family transposase [Streptococcus sp. KS 6]
MTSIAGIGNRLGAIIQAEIKNIHNFKNPAQLQAFAGLEPAIFQSGQMDNTGGMVKRGSTYLRYALIQVAKLNSQKGSISTSICAMHSYRLLS